MQVAASLRHMRALAAFPLFLLLAQAGATEAAGLGTAKVISGPGELLKVRIELILGPGDRRSKIQAAVASPAIPEDDSDNQLWVTVDPAPYGRAALTVRSIAPADKERMELVVAVSSPAGRAYRSYDLALPRPHPAAEAPSAPRSDQAVATAQNAAKVSPRDTALTRASAPQAAQPVPAQATTPIAPPASQTGGGASFPAEVDEAAIGHRIR